MKKNVEAKYTNRIMKKMAEDDLDYTPAPNQAANAVNDSRYNGGDEAAAGASIDSASANNVPFAGEAAQNDSRYNGGDEAAMGSANASSVPFAGESAQNDPRYNGTNDALDYTPSYNQAADAVNDSRYNGGDEAAMGASASTLNEKMRKTSSGMYDLRNNAKEKEEINLLKDIFN